MGIAQVLIPLLLFIQATQAASLSEWANKTSSLADEQVILVEVFRKGNQEVLFPSALVQLYFDAELEILRPNGSRDRVSLGNGEQDLEMVQGRASEFFLRTPIEVYRILGSQLNEQLNEVLQDWGDVPFGKVIGTIRLMLKKSEDHWWFDDPILDEVAIPLVVPPHGATLSLADFLRAEVIDFSPWVSARIRLEAGQTVLDQAPPRLAPLGGFEAEVILQLAQQAFADRDVETAVGEIERLPEVRDPDLRARVAQVVQSGLMLVLSDRLQVEYWEEVQRILKWLARGVSCDSKGILEVLLFQELVVAQRFPEYWIYTDSLLDSIVEAMGEAQDPKVQGLIDEVFLRRMPLLRDSRTWTLLVTAKEAAKSPSESK